MRNPSVYTRSNGQNLPSPRKSGLEYTTGLLFSAKSLSDPRLSHLLPEDRGLVSSKLESGPHDSNLSVFSQPSLCQTKSSSAQRQSSCLVASLGLTPAEFYALTFSSLIKASCLVYLCYLECLIYSTTVLPN